MIDFFKKVWNWIVSIPKDKLLHDYAACLIALFAFAVFLFLGCWRSMVVANIVSVAALIGKGVYDAFHPGSQSVEGEDFLYGLFGIAKFDCAAVIICLFVA